MISPKNNTSIMYIMDHFSRKKTVGMGMLFGLPTTLNNKYVQGSGVGSTSITAYRRKNQYAKEISNREANFGFA
jgi:hypothetical protein